MKMMGINPKTVPEPKYSMRPMIICRVPLVRARATPLNTLMEAREMIKEGALKIMQPTPMSVEHTMATKMPRSAAKGLDMPERIKIAAMQAVRPTLAPAEMSISPEMIK